MDQNPPQTTRDGRRTVPAVWVARSFALLAVSAAFLLLVGWLVGSLIEADAGAFLRAIDRSLLESFAETRISALTRAMRRATHLGDGLVVTILAVLGGIGSYLVTRKPRWPVFFAACVLVATQLSSITKALVGRARPTLSPVYELASDAFPSGHATAAAACYGALALLAGRALPRRWSLPVVSLSLFVILLVGMTRVYLGVHWPTDVLGGWALGGAWVAIVARVLRPDRADQDAP
ncbi:MAG: phosphatase PAP2 family protein [Actinomycetota bacterium]|nr:phosphatase PAP2 family protein [Actinomycetota bacterium]